MREALRIVTNRVLRDERTERRIMEMQRDNLYYTLMLAGAIMLIIALLW